MTDQKAFHEAVLDLQRAIIKIPFVKDKKAAYGKYLTLDALLDTALPVLHDHGFVLVQFVEDGDTLVTELRHETGTLTSTMPLIMPAQKTAMALGSAITYARRYSMLIILGISPDDDDDGAATATTTKPTNTNNPFAKKAA